MRKLNLSLSCAQVWTLVELPRNFCSNTTIHGFLYFAQARNFGERFLWAVVIGMGFYCCNVMIRESLVDWTLNPILTTTQTYSFPIQKIQGRTLKQSTFI